MFNPNVIIEWLSYVCLIALFVSRPLRKRRLLKRAGNCLLPLTRKKTLVLYAGIFIISACMLAVLRLRSFDFIIALVLRITAVLAAELAVRDVVCKDAAGVYENMLIAGGKTIPKTGIYDIDVYRLMLYDFGGDQFGRSHSSGRQNRAVRIHQGAADSRRFRVFRDPYIRDLFVCNRNGYFDRIVHTPH